jgi:[NiFe] hydrogenase diaphorase moiety large subunit
VTDECVGAERLGELLQPIIDGHGGDPGMLVQILREAQEVLGYLPAAALTAIARAVGLPRARVEGVAGFYSFLHLAPVGRYRVLFSDNITDRMLGSVESDGSPVQPAVDRARQGFRGRAGQRRYDFLHRHVRPGAGAAGQRPGDDPHVGRAHRPHQRTDPGTGAAGRLAARVFPGRGQHPPPRCPAQYLLAGRRSPQGRAGARTRGDARGNEGLEPARARRRRFHHLHQVGVGTRAPCRGEPPERYIVCNADEGEPGTFKDRVLLSAMPTWCSTA